MSQNPLLTLSDNDNIAVALQKIEPGNQLSSSGLVAQGAIPSGHKIALTEIASGQEIIKYGRVIGLATQGILSGEHVHVHNVAMAQFQRFQTYWPKLSDRSWRARYREESHPRQFFGCRVSCADQARTEQGADRGISPQRASLSGELKPVCHATVQSDGRRAKLI